MINSDTFLRIWYTGVPRICGFPDLPPVQQLRHPPLVNPACVSIHRDFRALGNSRGGRFGGQEGGDGKFPGQGGHVTGNTAIISDDGLGLGHGHHKFGGRMLGHQHRALGNAQQVFILPDQKSRPAAHPGKGHGAAFQ